MIYVENSSKNPFFNFALEYYLLTEKELEDDIIFMFWRTEPTLMVGKFQNTLEEINQKYVNENKINVVRRITGGGTIYTDLNGWQYSFIMKNYKSKKIDFEIFTKPIIDSLKHLGVMASFNNRNDLLIDNKKFSGNAQYIKDDVMLHHGSILFNTDIEEMVRCLTVDEEKIISKGIKSVKERVTNIIEHIDTSINETEFKSLMLKYLLKESKGIYKLTEEDIERVNEISKEKFEAWEWNYGSSPKFNIKKGKRLPGGKIEFNMDIKKGYIHEITINGDFFSCGDVSIVEKHLIGCKYEKDSISKLLDEIDVTKYFYKITKDQVLECII